MQGSQTGVSRTVSGLSFILLVDNPSNMQTYIQICQSTGTDGIYAVVGAQIKTPSETIEPGDCPLQCIIPTERSER